MTKEQMAQLLNGREYCSEITDAECEQAKADGLVVVFGYSDDNMEFRGAVHDEAGCYEGGEVYMIKSGILVNHCANEHCPHFLKARETAVEIKAVWCGDDEYSWTYKTDIPHATFDIMEYGDKFCRGIVFALADVPTITAS